MVQEIDPRLVDVVGHKIGSGGGQAHPREGQRIQPAGDVEQRPRLPGDAEDVGVELLEQRQALARRQVRGHDVAAGSADGGCVASGENGR